GLLQLALHLAMLAVTGTLVWQNRGTGWVVPAIVLHGIVLEFIFCALHEGVHRTAFRARRLNDAVGWVARALILLPLEYYRVYHYAHHRYTQDPQRDPELAVPKPTNIATYLLRVSGLSTWQQRLATTLRHALTGRADEPWVPAAKRRGIVVEARVLWACYL